MDPQTKSDTVEIFDGAYKRTVNIPITAEKFDEWSGSPGDCVDAANSNHIAHNLQGRWRSAVAAALVKAGYERKKVSKSGEKDVFEKENAYVQRLIAEGLTPDVLQKIGDEATEGLTFEATVKGGTTRGKIAAKYITQAQDAVAAWQAGVNPKTGQPASAEKTLAALRGRLTNAVLNDETDVDEVASLFRDYDNWKPASSLV